MDLGVEENGEILGLIQYVSWSLWIALSGP